MMQIQNQEEKMLPEQFTYWLQGFVEVNGEREITEQQWKIIKDHLKTVFKKVTPQYTYTENLPPIVPIDLYKIGDDPYAPTFIC